jgi:hypothetical protein
MEKPRSHKLIQRLIPTLTVWAVGKVLATPRIKAKIQEVDSRAYVKRRNAIRSAKRIGKNAASKPAWLAAGAAAIAVGIGLMAKAARGK